MRRTTKYVALDVHQSTTVSSVRDEAGRVIARTIIPTEAESLLAFVRSIRGAVHVAFEEGTQAQWLSELLTPVVQRVVVCNRRGDTTPGNKNDQHDAMSPGPSCIIFGWRMTNPQMSAAPSWSRGARHGTPAVE